MERYYNLNSVYIPNGKQEDMIVEYIKQNGCITNIEAVYRLGISQCPARIWGLKQRGVNIKSRWKEVEDRYGKTKRVKEYYIGEAQ